MLKLVGKFRWTIIGLFVGAMVINYLSRSVLGVAAPVILEEQRISSVEYGWITGAFQLGVMLQPLALMRDPVTMMSALAPRALLSWGAAVWLVAAWSAAWAKAGA